MKKTLLFTLFLGISLVYFAQKEGGDKAEAQRLGRQAIMLMDEGRIEESVILLEQAQKLDPDNMIYPYEIGLAYYRSEQYDKAIKIYKKLVKRDAARRTHG